MAEPVRLFIAAGEPSGDRIGADLVKRLRTRRDVRVTGIGGTELTGEGLISLFPMSDLSVMGITDVMARLPLLWWRIRQTVKAIVAGKPDAVVLVDSQVFSATVAKRARAGGYRGPMLLYVAPSVWAWKPERAKELRGIFDEILAVLPFEPEVMRSLGGPVTHYVGHPALERIADRTDAPARGPLLLLPGSRAGELRRHLPIMEDVAAAFAAHGRVTRLILPTPASQAAHVAEVVGTWKVPVEVAVSRDQRTVAFGSAIAAAAVSGTVTLELALAGVPMVATYVADAGQHRRWVAVGSPLAALPNILARRTLVPELIGRSAQTDQVIAALRALLDDPDRASAQRDGFRAIRREMEAGITDPAMRVLSYLA